MPWFNLNRMKDGDLRAIYEYIRHLGPGGRAAGRGGDADTVGDMLAGRGARVVRTA